MSVAAARTRGGAIDRWRRRLREAGLRDTLAKAFGDHVYRRSSSVVLEYRTEWGALGRAFDIPAGVAFVTVEGAGATLPRLGGWLAPRQVAFQAMLAAGKIGVFAVEHGAAVGCAWLSLTDHHDAESREHYRVAPGEAYHYCWLVDPARRRANIALPLCRAVLLELRGRGVTRQFGVIDRTNRASYLIQQRFGYRECGIEVIHLYVLRTRWTWTRRYQGVLGLLPSAGGR